MHELASSSAQLVDPHDHTDLCEESYCVKNTKHSTGLPSSSAQRVFTLP